jgi:hypothetical protein
MKFTRKQIKDYQTLYNERYGVEISEEEAYEQGLKLVELVKFIFKPSEEKRHE